MHRGGQAGEFKEITLSFRSRYSAGMLSTQYPFSFHKEPCVEASCPYIFISSLWRASKVRAEKRGSLWAQVSWAPTIPPSHHNTPDSCTLLPLNLSAAPTHCSRNVSAGRVKGVTSMCVWASMCFWQKKKKKNFCRNAKFSALLLWSLVSLSLFGLLFTSSHMFKLWFC